jgi:exopolysaccharide production protein ExoZ
MTLIAVAFAPAINSSPPSLTGFLKSLFFVSFSDGTMPLVFVGWTLEYEMYFYFAVFLFLLIGAQAWRALIIWLSASIIIGNIFVYQTDLVFRFFSNPIILEFCIGISIAQFKLGKSDMISLAAILSAYLSTLLSNPSQRLVTMGLLAAAFVTIAALLSDRKLKSHIGTAIVFFGNASYGIYLTHVWTVSGSAKLLSRVSEHMHLDLFILTAGMLSIIVGCLWYAAIEVPISRLLRRRYERFNYPEVPVVVPSVTRDER